MVGRTGVAEGPVPEMWWSWLRTMRHHIVAFDLLIFSFSILGSVTSVILYLGHLIIHSNIEMKGFS